VHAVVEIRCGTFTGRATVPEGRAIAFGAGETADVRLPEEAGVAPVCFVAQATEDACAVRGVEGCASFTAREGDTRHVGGATFTFRFAFDAPWFDGAPCTTCVDPSLQATSWSVPRGTDATDAAIAFLRRLPAPAYALLDAARDPGVLAWIHASRAGAASLFPGEPGIRMAKGAPYLAEISRDDATLESIVRRAWGKSWGVFLASRRSLDELVTALQRLLVVRDPGGTPMLFRFYDPRVLRTFLPIATPHQADTLCAGVEAFVFEGPRRGTFVCVRRAG